MIVEQKLDKADVKDRPADKASEGKKLKGKGPKKKIVEERAPEIVVLKRKEYEKLISQTSNDDEEAGQDENQLEEAFDLDRTSITAEDAKASSRMITPRKEGAFSFSHVTTQMSVDTSFYNFCIFRTIYILFLTFLVPKYVTS